MMTDEYSVIVAHTFFFSPLLLRAPTVSVYLYPHEQRASPDTALLISVVLDTPLPVMLVSFIESIKNKKL